MKIENAIAEAVKVIIRDRGKLSTNPDTQHAILGPSIKAIQDALGHDDGGLASQIDVYANITGGLLSGWSESDLLNYIQLYVGAELKRLP